MSDGGTAIREPQRGQVAVDERDDGYLTTQRCSGPFGTKGLLGEYRQGKRSPVARRGGTRLLMRRRQDLHAFSVTLERRRTLLCEGEGT